MNGRNPVSVHRVSDLEFAVSRTFEAPVEAVFEAWVRADLFRRWWSPRSMGAVISGCEIDARTGGGYRITFGSGAESMTFHGRYLEVVPGARMVWTNEEDGDGPVTSVTFEARGAQTALVLSERYPSAGPVGEAMEGARTLMAEQFAQLDDLLANPAGRT